MKTLNLVLVAVLAQGACNGKSELPPDPGGTPNWDDIDFDQAIDLGFKPGEVDPGQRVPAGPITLVDVTDAAGLGNAHGGGNSHGVGVAFVDVDGDELPDIFVANGFPNGASTGLPSLLYRNQGDGTFRDVTAASGIQSILGARDCYSAAAGDFDGDGAVDLYVGAQPTDVLLRNCSTGGTICFEDVTGAAGAGGPPSNPALVGDGKSKVVAFGDFDGDGDLDIASASSTLPRPFAYQLRNNGDGTFSDISSDTGVRASPAGNPCAIMWSDHDSDGDSDLWIWNDRGGHILLRNEAGKHFEDITESSALDQVSITHPMGIDAADIDHDGDLDYYISNIGNNPLLRNNGDGTFVDITGQAGTAGDFGWGLAFEDLDSDSFADIFVAQEDNRPNLVFHNLAKSPPAFERLEVPHTQVNTAAHNVAAGFADYDRDGRVDMITATTDGSRIMLYRNETDLGSHGWLHVAVRLPVGAENPHGIGVRVAVKTGELIQFRDVTGGSSRASQNELSVRFGLADYTGADWVAALWPGGRQIVVTGVEGNHHLILPPVLP